MLTMPEPDWNTASLKEYQHQESRDEDQPERDWRGERLDPARFYMIYNDEIFDTEEALDFLEHLGAEDFKN